MALVLTRNRPKTAHQLELNVIVNLTFGINETVESDSSVDDDCPPTLLKSPQIIGLLFVQKFDGGCIEVVGEVGKICGDGCISWN